MDTQRFTKIKTFSDIKLEKARLRYEVLALKTNLNENARYFSNLSNYTSMFASAGYGFNFGKKIVTGAWDLVSKLWSWKKKKKHKKNGHGPYDYDF